MRPFFRSGVSDAEIERCIANRNCGSIVDINLHDETLIKNWNNVVSDEDYIYHLGDFSFGRQDDYLKKLNGRKIFIKGNHDKGIEVHRKYFCNFYAEAPLTTGLTFGKDKYIMCHYPMWAWNWAFHGIIHFFGHEHTSPHKNFYCAKNSYDVGVDGNEMKPIRIEEAAEKAKTNPLSINIEDYLKYIKKENEIIKKVD